MRVRWALEELGVAYDVQLLTFAEMKQPAHLARNPFGQIPTWQDGGQVLFESGAIVLHLAEQHPGLLPRDPDARMRAIMWVFAAVNTVEPPIVERSMAWVLEREQPWYAQRLPMLDERVRMRLASCPQRWAIPPGSAVQRGDLMMVSVLLRLKSSGLLDEYPQVAAMGRATQRPAYQRAFRCAAGGIPERVARPARNTQRNLRRQAACTSISCATRISIAQPDSSHGSMYHCALKLKSPAEMRFQPLKCCIAATTNAKPPAVYDSQGTMRPPGRANSVSTPSTPMTVRCTRQYGQT
jgi:glutathione S-transferase